MRTDDLISELAAGLRPVRRVWHPAVATGVWAAIAAAVIGTAALAFGLRDDLPARLASGFDLPQILAAAVTGLLAAFSAFQLALPDRDRRWSWLPMPAVGAWLAVLGGGCLQDLARLGPGALQLSTSFTCLAFITGLGIPLTLGMLWLARHAAFLRPGPVAALGGLSAAALASVGLSCFHDLNAAAMVLAWHGMSVVVVTAVAALIGPRLMHKGVTTSPV